MRLNYSNAITSSLVRDNRTRPFATITSAAVLIAGLTGCTGAPRQDEKINGWTMAPAVVKPRTADGEHTPKRADEFGAECRGYYQFRKRISVGDIVRFGATFRGMTGMEVTSITDNTTEVNILVSVAAPLPAINIVSFTFKIKNIKLPTNEVEALFNISCSPELADYSQISTKEADRISRGLENIRATLGKIGIRQLGEFLLTINIPNGEHANATVVEERDNEIVLDINGRRVTLDREVKINTEFVFERSGYFTMPLRLEVDEEGGLKAVVDCRPGKAAYMEIFMSEHSNLDMRRMPFCQPK